MQTRGRGRLRLGMALAATIAVTSGALGAVAPASAELVRISDHVLVPASHPVADLPAGTALGATMTLSDGSVWAAAGTDLVRFSSDGTTTRFPVYPSGTATALSSTIALPDGFVVRVTASDSTVHWMHVAANGQADELPLAAGVQATDLSSPVPSPDGSIWFDAHPAGRVTDPDLLMHVAAGAATTVSTTAKVGVVLPTADGGAYAATYTSLVRIAPDGSVTAVPATVGYRIGSVWTAADGSVWFLGVNPTSRALDVGRVRSDGTVETATPQGVYSLTEVGTTAQAGTWLVGIESTTGRRVVFAGTSPSGLHETVLPTTGASDFAVAGERLWASDSTPPAGSPATVVSIGSGGDVRLEASIDDLAITSLTTAPDGTVWAFGHPQAGWSSYRVVALGADGGLRFGSTPAPPAGALAFTADGTPWFSTGSTGGGVVAVQDAAADRLDGSTRYDAAAKIATAAFPTGASVAFVASGQNFPDALSAGPVAAAEGGPLLLTLPGSLPTVTHDALAALKPTTIVVVGGTASVSETVLTQLRAITPDVSRISGDDRYAVSHDLVAAHQTTGKPLFVATGAGYADAVTAGAAAARAGGQLLLVPGDRSSLPAGYSSFITGLAPSSIAVVGGSATVSNGILNQLNGIATATRYGGADRYAVSAAVVSAFGTPSAHVYLTTGRTFPDALAAAPLAGRSDATLVSVPGTCVPAGTLSAIDGARPSKVTVLGGTDSVSADASWLSTC